MKKNTLRITSLSYFLIVANFVTAQLNSSLVNYEIKLAEDVFFFDASLELGYDITLFTYKKNKTSKWFRENESVFKTQVIFTDSIGHKIYRKFNDDKLLVRSFCRQDEPIVYEDSSQFNWKIINEEKNISGVQCKKAITLFRGREYIAWFALSIPIDSGPWKFHGLPGLILEVSDKNQEVQIFFKGIQKKSGTNNLPPLEEINSTLALFSECLDDEYSKFYQRNAAIIARFQAQDPEVEFRNTLPIKRPATELEFDR